jgi:transposase-like protein
VVEGASVAKIELSHELNANLVSNWRRLYQKERLCGRVGRSCFPTP